MLQKLRLSGTKQITLTTEHLTVSSAVAADATELSLYYIRNRDFLAPWEPRRESNFFSLAGWQMRLPQLVELQKRDLAYYFVLRRSGERQIIGVITYSNVLQYPMHSCYVGYSLDEACQSQGYMSEALAATNQWMFDERNLHRIMAGYMPRNKASARVLEKQGFEIEGRAKDYLLIDGKWEDHVLTALTNQHWKE
uniref:ribosomal protein S5-alanine N-acetyltransferase n=1 Tax=Thaumasiovibrio occultus TaxID=1891184 RepID=UPI000B35BE09|nr:ribosomal protein S5-alanine N-acetyltransferase [Thaumasiovibrio occultus]